MSKQLVGAKLGRMRIDAGLLNKRLAERLGWQTSKITRIEQGKQRPTLQDLALWVGACGQDIAEVDALWSLLHGAAIEPSQAAAAQPQLLGVSITDATMTRLLNWAVTRGFTVEEAINVLLSRANLGDQ